MRRQGLERLRDVNVEPVERLVRGRLVLVDEGFLEQKPPLALLNELIIALGLPIVHLGGSGGLGLVLRRICSDPKQVRGEAPRDRAEHGPTVDRSKGLPHQSRLSRSGARVILEEEVRCSGNDLSNGLECISLIVFRPPLLGKFPVRIHPPQRSAASLDEPNPPRRAG